MAVFPSATSSSKKGISKSTCIIRVGVVRCLRFFLFDSRILLISIKSGFLCTRACSAMSPRDLNDAKHWRDRAAELRGLAESYLDKKTAAILLRRAGDYDRMAEQAADKAKRGRHLSRSNAPTKEQLQ